MRPARPEDSAEVIRLGATAFPPDSAQERAEGRERRRARFERALEEDAGGAWVAEAEEGGLDGVVIALVREGIWVLSFLAVHPGAQGSGLGRGLMAAALRYGEEARGGLIAASLDGRGWRLYAAAGFELRPTLCARGRVDRALLPAVSGVREGTADDLEGCDAVDRRVRGGARGGDLLRLLDLGARLHVADGGYAIGKDGHCIVLAADKEETATSLLWSVLAEAPEDGEGAVDWISAGQDWAFRVCFAARLELAPYGPYFTRGRLGPLRPWLPSGPFL